ncbi:MAG: uL15 family ribosomal protein [Candidatus Marsarchaeota archaeon]|nr:uL15 family ribosomal protein [Candidatus Marsarchaeota archaeon]
MVIRKEKRNRKYHGTRRWGMGNIKNARGAGGRGGIGEINRLRKHDWTYITAKAPELIRKKGFAPRHRHRMEVINLTQINEMLKNTKEQKATLEFKGYKVLSKGTINRPVTIKASQFSKNAIEKIKAAGGEAAVISNNSASTQPQ